MLSWMKHGSFPSLCIGENHGSVLEYSVKVIMVVTNYNDEWVWKAESHLYSQAFLVYIVRTISYVIGVVIWSLYDRYMIVIYG